MGELPGGNGRLESLLQRDQKHVFSEDNERDEGRFANQHSPLLERVVEPRHASMGAYWSLLSQLHRRRVGRDEARLAEAPGLAP